MEQLHQGISFSPDFQVLVDEVDLASEDYDNEISEYDRKWEEEQKQKRYIESGVKERYWDKRLEDFVTSTEEQKTQLAKVTKFITDVNNHHSRTMWMCGNAGTGKTLLASLIIRECGGKFVKSYEIQNELEDCRSFKATESKTQLIQRYADYRVLVIDEIAKIDSKAEIEYLFMILNERYERMKSTILITNKSAKELMEYIGKPLYDRFVENCTSLTFNGESYRKNERED